MGRLVGPVMLAMLVCIAILVLFVIQSPDLSAKFQRPESYYDNTFEKVGVALAIAAIVSLLVWIVRRFTK